MAAYLEGSIHLPAAMIPTPEREIAVFVAEKKVDFPLLQSDLALSDPIFEKAKVNIPLLPGKLDSFHVQFPRKRSGVENARKRIGVQIQQRLFGRDVQANRFRLEGTLEGIANRAVLAIKKEAFPPKGDIEVLECLLRQIQKDLIVFPSDGDA